MNVIKANPVGIDKPINQLQVYLYPLIKTAWGLDDTKYQSYGRAYKNQNGTGYTPEVYQSANEYQEVYFDDTLAALSFYGVGDIQTLVQPTMIADVYLIFMVNLNTIKPGSTRNDEEAHVDVEKAARLNYYGFQYSGLVTGIDQVFKEYSGWDKDKGMRFRDMHPKHCFRLNFKLQYNFFNKC